MSSTNLLTNLATFTSLLFLYITNNKGPIIDPHRTLLISDFQPEYSPSTLSPISKPVLNQYDQVTVNPLYLNLLYRPSMGIFIKCLTKIHVTNTLPSSITSDHFYNLLIIVTTQISVSGLFLCVVCSYPVIVSYSPEIYTLAHHADAEQQESIHTNTFYQHLIYSLLHLGNSSTYRYSLNYVLVSISYSVSAFQIPTTLSIIKFFHRACPHLLLHNLNLWILVLSVSDVGKDFLLFLQLPLLQGKQTKLSIVFFLP